MSKVKILVVEDEIITSMQISDLLDELGYDVIETVTNYESAVDSLVNKKPDLALLDIELEGEKSGIDIAHFIKENINIPYIFLTTKSDFRTIDSAKRLNPSAYLMKPFVSNDLYSSIEIALYNFNSSIQKLEENSHTKSWVSDSIFVKENKLFYKVKLTDILFAKSEHIYVELNTDSGKTFLIRSSLQSFIEDLPSNFFRVHRSYVVNLDQLESINSFYVKIKDQKIPIGKNYRDELMKKIKIK